MLVGPKLRRAGVETYVVGLAEAIGCAVVLEPAAKGVFPEDHAQFAGIFRGQISTLEANVMFNWADMLLCVGTMFTDYSTVGWTAMPTMLPLIVDVDSVTAPDYYFSNVQMCDFLPRLAKVVRRNDSTMVEYKRLRVDRPVQRPASQVEALNTKEVNRQLQTLISSSFVVFAEKGDSWFNATRLCLPREADFEIEMQWGHIGWTIPASFGYEFITGITLGWFRRSILPTPEVMLLASKRTQLASSQRQL